MFEVMREMLKEVLECICLHKGFHSALGSVYNIFLLTLLLLY